MKKYYTWIPLFLITTATYLFADIASRSFFKLTSVTATASSVLQEKGQPASFYAPDKAVDFNSKTAWCEGKSGDGIGEWLELKFKPVYTNSLNVGHGILVNRILYNENNRIKDYELQISLKNGKSEKITGSFKDKSCGEPEQRGTCMEAQTQSQSDACWAKLQNECYNNWGHEYSGKDGEEIAFNGIKCIVGFKLTIKSVYPGTKYKDTCISEISANDWAYVGMIRGRLNNQSDYDNLSGDIYINDQSVSKKDFYKLQKECEFDK